MALSLLNLGETLRDKGAYAEAEPLLRQALTMLRRVLNDRHPDVAQGAKYLALLLYQKGDYAEAEALYQTALSINLEQYGESHPRVQEVHTQLAELYEAWGKPDQAVRYR